MILFEVENNRVTFSPQALELRPFKALWDRDKTSDKKHAVAELSYVYFFSDYKSDFSNIIDEETRKEEIIAVLPNFKLKKADTLIEQACQFYLKRQNTISMELLFAIRLGVDKIKEFFVNFDLRKLDKNGRPVYNIKQINDIIRDIGKTITGLKDVEEQVMKELEVKNSMRGTREKNLFEDGELGTDV